MRWGSSANKNLQDDEVACTNCIAFNVLNKKFVDSRTVEEGLGKAG